jgi:hypothetical protein
MFSVDPTGEFSRQRQKLLCIEMNKSTEELIIAEIQHVRDVANEKYEKLQFASDVHTGVEILHLFVLDLLGRDTPVAKIFLTKSEEDFRHSMVVSRWVKGLAWVIVVLLNLFFVYFSMLRGLQRGTRWQNLYLMACILQLFIEMVVYETSECAIVHYVVPSLARNEVQSASFMLHQAIQNICFGNKIDEAVILDAPRYLFVSTNLADRFPDLLESVIVHSYHTYSPGEFAKKWHISHAGVAPSFLYSSLARSFQRVKRFTVTALVMSLLQRLGAMSPTLQRVAIHTMQPLIMSVVFVVAFLLIAHPWLFPVFLPFMAYICYCIYASWKRQRLTRSQSRLSGIFPEEKLRSSGQPRIAEEEQKSEEQSNSSACNELCPEEEEQTRGAEPVLSADLVATDSAVASIVVSTHAPVSAESRPVVAPVKQTEAEIIAYMLHMVQENQADIGCMSGDDSDDSNAGGVPKLTAKLREPGMMDRLLQLGAGCVDENERSRSHNQMTVVTHHSRPVEPAETIPQTSEGSVYGRPIIDVDSHSEQNEAAVRARGESAESDISITRDSSDSDNIHNESIGPELRTSARPAMMIARMRQMSIAREKWAQQSDADSDIDRESSPAGQSKVEGRGLYDLSDDSDDNKVATQHVVRTVSVSSRGVSYQQTGGAVPQFLAPVAAGPTMQWAMQSPRGTRQHLMQGDDYTLSDDSTDSDAPSATVNRRSGVSAARPPFEPHAAIKALHQPSLEVDPVNVYREQTPSECSESGRAIGNRKATPSFHSVDERVDFGIVHLGVRSGHTETNPYELSSDDDDGA